MNTPETTVNGVVSHSDPCAYGSARLLRLVGDNRPYAVRIKDAGLPQVGDRITIVGQRDGRFFHATDWRFE